MTEYFLPDRSRRPASPDDGTIREILADRTLAGELEDGRPFILELSVVDGYPVHLFYFDVRGLERSSVDDLRDLIERSIDRPLFPVIDGTEIACEATVCTDAQGRSIWELAAVWFQAD